MFNRFHVKPRDCNLPTMSGNLSCAMLFCSSVLFENFRLCNDYRKQNIRTYHKIFIAHKQVSAPPPPQKKTLSLSVHKHAEKRTWSITNHLDGNPYIFLYPPPLRRPSSPCRENTGKCHLSLTRFPHCKLDPGKCRDYEQSICECSERSDGLTGSESLSKLQFWKK